MYWMTFPWHLHKVMSVALIKILICTIEWESLTRSLQNVVSISRKWCLLPDYTFVKFWWKRLFWRFVPQNFGCMFSRSKTTWTISQKWLVQLTWKEVEVHLLDVGETIWPWPLTWSVNLTFDFSRSNFEIAVSYELLVWLMSNGKKLINLIIDWPYDLAFGNTHDLDLEVSRSKFEISLTQEKERQLTWYKRDGVIHSWPWHWPLCDHVCGGGLTGLWPGWV